MFAESCKLTIRSSTVTKTQAKAAGGGGLKSTGSQIKLFNVLFNGTASFGNSGGAIDLRLSSIDITSSIFDSCNSIGDARNAIAGGAMSLSVRSTCNTVDSTFSSNVASSGGKSTLFLSILRDGYFFAWSNFCFGFQVVQLYVMDVPV